MEPQLIKEQLKKIDQRITFDKLQIIELINQISFTPLFEFELNAETGEINKPELNKNGIYFFEIKNRDGLYDIEMWKNVFQPLWEAGEVIWTPGLKKGRLRCHHSFSDWIPFYIGKHKNILKRLNEHIHQSHDKTTFSMKLKARKKLHGHVFRISYIPLELENYDILAPVMENGLRNRFNPLCGKQ